MTASVASIDDLTGSLSARKLRAEGARTAPRDVPVLIVQRDRHWLDQAARDLVSFLKLEPGWDSYGARALSLETANDALQLLARLQAFGVPRPLLVPTPKGGVQLEWDVDGVELELELQPRGPILVMYEDVDGNGWERVLPPNDLATLDEILERIAKAGRHG